MKRNILLFALGCLIAAVILSACGTEKEPEEITAQTTVAEEAVPTTMGFEGVSESDEEIPDETISGEFPKETENTISTIPDKESSVNQEGKETEESRPEETAAEETEADEDEINYEKYVQMTPAEQQEFFETFESVDAYFEWLNKAKEEFEKNSVTGDGSPIDIGDYMK